MRASLIKRGRRYHAKIQLPTWTNEKRVSLGTTDKRVASIALEKLVRDFELVEAGVLAPLAARKAATKSLVQLCADYVQQLDVSKRSVWRYESCLKVVREETGWTQLQHVTESSFRQWLRESPLRASTRNDYLAVWVGLFKWLRRERLVQQSPLEFVDKLDETRTAREYRRALTPAEVKALFACEGIPRARRTIYRLFLETGLRGTELRELRVGDFFFAGGEISTAGNGGASMGAERSGAAQRGPQAAPRTAGGSPPPAGEGEGARGREVAVRVPASVAKNRKEVLLPLDPQTAREVAQLIPPDAPPFALALAGLVPRNETFQRDLRKIGIAATDTMGRRVDIHALRKSFGTALVLSGAEPRVVMEAMRHSDLKLTMKTYMDAAQLRGPVALAVASLPWCRNEPPAQAEKA